MDLESPFRDDVGAVATESPISGDQQKGCGVVEVRVAPHLRATRPLAERPPVAEPTYRTHTVVVEHITQDGVITSLDGVLVTEGRNGDDSVGAVA